MRSGASTLLFTPKGRNLIDFLAACSHGGVKRLVGKHEGMMGSWDASRCLLLWTTVRATAMVSSPQI